MTWQDIKAKYRTLRDAAASGDATHAPWRDFAATARAAEPDSLVHLRAVLGTLAQYRPDTERARIRILDHGAGSGINMLYLAAVGYADIWGVNVIDKAQPLNRVFREALGCTEDRILVYDGLTLPFADGIFDVVISQQVVEHLGDGEVERYYAEEGRVLAPGGVAFHQVPHRAIPYDSHTRTWFLHYLPRRTQLRAYRALGHDADHLAHYLHLRPLSFHFAAARRAIGPVRDLTLERLVHVHDTEAYDDAGTLRRVLLAALAAPLVGGAARRLLRHFLVAETVATKPAA